MANLVRCDGTVQRDPQRRLIAKTARMPWSVSKVMACSLDSTPLPQHSPCASESTSASVFCVTHPFPPLLTDGPLGPSCKSSGTSRPLHRRATPTGQSLLSCLGLPTRSHFPLAIPTPALPESGLGSSRLHAVSSVDHAARQSLNRRRRWLVLRLPTFQRSTATPSGR
jgi:hypothetical protein